MKISKQNNKKILTICIVFLVAIFALCLFYFFFRNDPKEQVVSNDSTVKYEPATNVEKKETQENKDKIIASQKDKNDPNNSAGDNKAKKAVEPIISNSSDRLVTAYVAGVFEDGGKCEAIFTNGSVEKTKQSVGFQNVSYTQCAPLNLEPGFLTTGTWTLQVKYTSNTSSGISDKQEIRI